MKQYKDMNQLERWFRTSMARIGDWFHKHGVSPFDTIDWNN